MNILIITLGSRGDVQPYVALGKGLQAAGHAVTVCTSSGFEGFITGHGLNYGYMSNDLLEMMDSVEGRNVIDNGAGPFGMVKTMIRLMKESQAVNRRLLEDTWKTAQAVQPDLIIFHAKALGGPHIAEKLGVPVILAMPVPLVPTSEFPAIGLPDLKIGGFNRFSYKLIQQGYSAYNGVVNAFRQDTLGLDKMRSAAAATHMADGNPIPVLHAISAHVLPRPHDWPDHVHLSGYWFLDETNTWEPSAELAAFLDAGDPPVYVGFGSMAGRSPEKLARVVIAALQQAGVRGIIASGWGGLSASDLPDTIFQIDQAPHDWLFPRMSAVVHHGGAGTTAAGLRAGRPTIICPFIVDQPFWGQRVRALGVGSEPIPHKKLTPEKLAAAIREVTTDPAIPQQAAALGEKIRQEDGIANTVTMIESMVPEPLHFRG